MAVFSALLPSLVECLSAAPSAYDLTSNFSGCCVTVVGVKSTTVPLCHFLHSHGPLHAHPANVLGPPLACDRRCCRSDTEAVPIPSTFFLTFLGGCQKSLTNERRSCRRARVSFADTAVTRRGVQRRFLPLCKTVPFVQYNFPSDFTF